MRTRRLLALVFACLALLLALGAVDAKSMTSGAAIRRVFGSSRLARCIARHESHFNRRAVSSTGDYGLFQINARTWFGRVIRFRRTRIYVQRRWIFDPLYNAKVAWVISRGGRNWHPWTTLRYCV